MSSSNPMEILNSIINQNPAIKNLISIFNSSGLSPKKFFYQYANSQGIDPDQFINSLLQQS